MPLLTAASALCSEWHGGRRSSVGVPVWVGGPPDINSGQRCSGGILSQEGEEPSAYKMVTSHWEEGHFLSYL